MPFFSGHNTHSSTKVFNHFTNFTIPLLASCIQCLRTRQIDYYLEVKTCKRHDI